MNMGNIIIDTAKSLSIISI